MVSGAVAVGWRAVKMNRLPVVVLWSAAVLLVTGYYRVPFVAAVLEPLERWQCAEGAFAAFANRVVFCGLLPGVFLMSVKSIRPPRVALVILAYSLWAGLWGVLCDGFLTVQEMWFGTGHDALTICKKTLVDQFVRNVWICTPANAVFFPWVESDFRRPGSVRKGFGSMLVANWIVWLPVMAVVYVFPLPLQIQLVGLAGALWMLVALRSGK